jgi:hypothetical protein
VHQLYSDDAEVLFEAARPVILNGIQDVVGRPDLADRAIILTLPPINDAERRPVTELWAEFSRVRPAILGALLDIVAHGLARRSLVRRRSLPRMADFALWTAACETALWPAGTIARAYGANRRAIIESIIEADPLAACACNIMVNRNEWAGTASDFLQAADKLQRQETLIRRPDWPRCRGPLPADSVGPKRRCAP